MKAECYRDMILLCELYVQGKMTADEYYACVDEYSKLAVEEELRIMKTRRKRDS